MLVRELLVPCVDRIGEFAQLLELRLHVLCGLPARLHRGQPDVHVLRYREQSLEVALHRFHAVTIRRQPRKPDRNLLAELRGPVQLHLHLGHRVLLPLHVGIPLVQPFQVLAHAVGALQEGGLIGEDGEPPRHLGQLRIQGGESLRDLRVESVYGRAHAFDLGRRAPLQIVRAIVQRPRQIRCRLIGTRAPLGLQTADALVHLRLPARVSGFEVFAALTQLGDELLLEVGELVRQRLLCRVLDVPESPFDRGRRRVQAGQTLLQCRALFVDPAQPFVLAAQPPQVVVHPLAHVHQLGQRGVVPVDTAADGLDLHGALLEVAAARGQILLNFPHGTQQLLALLYADLHLDREILDFGTLFLHEGRQGVHHPVAVALYFFQRPVVTVELTKNEDDPQRNQERDDSGLEPHDPLPAG